MTCWASTAWAALVPCVHSTAKRATAWTRASSATGAEIGSEPTRPGNHWWANSCAGRSRGASRGPPPRQGRSAAETPSARPGFSESCTRDGGHRHQAGELHPARASGEGCHHHPQRAVGRGAEPALHFLEQLGRRVQEVLARTGQGLREGALHGDTGQLCAAPCADPSSPGGRRPAPRQYRTGSASRPWARPSRPGLLRPPPRATRRER